MSRLDDYIVAVLSRMEVDDAQRLEIERELRTHLEEAIADGVEKGLSREQAEDEAMVAFGDAKGLARRFGAKSGVAWLYFEGFAYAVGGTLVTFLLHLVKPDDYPLWLVLVAFVFLGALVLKSAYDRVEVNGGIFLRRLGRRPVKVPFSAIEKVRFEKGHLMGPRNLVIEHHSGKLKFGSRLRGTRAAAVALEALAGDTMSPPVREYLEKLSIRVRREKPVFRWLLSAAWVLPLIAGIVNLPSVWQGLGFNVLLLPAFLAPFPLYLIQGRFHADRSRSGITGLLLPLTIFSVLVFFVGTVAGSLWGMRWGLLLLVTMAGIGLLLLWWRGSRRSLLAACALIVLAAFVSVFFLGHDWAPVRAVAQLETPPLLVQECRWTADGRILVQGFREETPSSRLFFGKPGEERLQESALEEGWILLPPTPNGNIYLAAGQATGDLHAGERSPTILYHLDWRTGSLVPVAGYPPALDLWPLHLTGAEIWSPDGRWVLGRWADKEKKKENWGLFNLVTGATAVIHGATAGTQALWEDEVTLRVADIEYPNPDLRPEAPPQKGFLRVSRIHVETETVESIAEHVVESQGMFKILPGLDYAIYADPEVTKRERSSETDTIGNLVFFDLSTGETTDLGSAQWGMFKYTVSWDTESQRLLFVRPETPATGPVMTVFEPKTGMITEKEFPPGHIISFTDFSPGGQMVLYLRAGLFPVHWRPLISGRYEIWDIESDGVFPIDTAGVFEILFAAIRLFPNHGFPSWSPDANLIAFSRPGYLDGAKGTSIEFIDLEKLREKG